MRLPINLFLFLGSTAMLVQGGWFFCHASPQIWAKSPNELHKTGLDDALRLLARGKGKGPTTVSWSYLQKDWWEMFQTANFTGKLPPKEPEKPGPEVPRGPVPLDQRPLEQIIDLISLMYDPPIGDGVGRETHVVVRYKPEANVEPPPEVLKQYISMPSSAAALVRDVAPAGAAPAGKPPAAPPRSAPALGANNRPMTSLPISSGQREYVQYLKVGDKLWGRYDNIRLMEVSKDAEVAYFSRTLPPAPADPASPADPAKPAPASTEQRDKLFKTGMNLSQKMLEMIYNATGHAAPAGREKPAAAAVVSPTKWIEDPNGETKRVGSTIHIGRKDEQQLQENQDSLLSQVNLASYRSPNISGLRIVNVDASVAQRFGIARGDVILSINGEPVQSKADAINLGRRQYERGTREFVVRYLSGGQIVDRTYQAPDRH